MQTAESDFSSKLIGSVAWKNVYTSQDNIFCGYIAHYNSKLVETTE